MREARERIEELDDALGDADAGANIWQNIQRTSFPVEQAWLADIAASWDDLPDAIRAVNAWIANEAPEVLELVPEDERPDLEAVPVPTRGGMQE